MSDRKKHGVALIGLGMAVDPHAKSFKDLADRLEVRAAYSRSAERRQAFAERHGFPVTGDLDAVIADPTIDIAVVATPPDARLDLCKRLVAAGKHILVEKPVERSTKAAAEIVEAAQAAGVTMGVVLQHRFREASEQLAALLADNTLGSLEAVCLTVPWWRPQSYYEQPGRGTYARDGGGVLITQAIHVMDLMLSLTGPAAEVAAIAGKTSMHKMESEEFVGAGLRFANGAVGSLSATVCRYPGVPECIQLICTKAVATLEAGTLRLDWLDGREESFGERTTTGGGADPMAFPHDWHRGVIADFLDALDEGRQPRISGREALNVHRLIDALLLSAAERRHVTLDEV